MRTVNKIFLFIIFVFSILAAVTFTALNQYNELGSYYRTQHLTEESVEKGLGEELAGRHVIWSVFWLCLFFIAVMGLLLIYRLAYPLDKLRLKVSEFRKKFGLENARRASAGLIPVLDKTFDTMAEKIEALSGLLEEQEKSSQDRLENRRRQSELEKVNKELDDFVYTVSHDIRAPLTGIAGYADYLRKKFYDQMDVRSQRSIDGIIKSTSRLDQLINDILEVTRITRVKNPYERTDFNEVLRSVLERLEYDIERLNVEIVVEKSLPTIVSDKIKMTRVFYNLINNAIKFTSKVAGQRPRIEIGFKDYPEFVEFYVKDNGVGIPEHLQEEIFELFKRVHPADEYEGTGAGLSIVRTTVEDLGGRVWVNSKPGYGATFHFTLPKTPGER